MKIDILTLFPNMFVGPFGESIVKRAIDKKLVEIEIHNLRKWSEDKHKTVDGKPFGGGAGMVMKVDVIDRALRELKKQSPLTSITDLSTKPTSARVIFLTPQGKPYKQEKAREFSKLDHVIFICGHYEGVDERVREKLVDEEISIGDYVLTGGEIPAMAVVDSLVRLIPGVVGNEESVKDESFSEPKHQGSEPSFASLQTAGDSEPTRSKVKGAPSRTDLESEVRNPKTTLEYPQYTRPANYKGMKVPDILLSGHHKDIESWRKKESIKRTKKVRPDLV